MEGTENTHQISADSVIENLLDSIKELHRVTAVNKATYDVVELKLKEKESLLIEKDARIAELEKVLESYTEIPKTNA